VNDRSPKAGPPRARKARRPAPRSEPKERPAKAPEGVKRSGAVALIGRANVGKSTLLNAALGQDLAIVSQTPQTTRDTLLGVLHRGSAELRLLDTPGLHRPKSELGRVMNHHAREAARAADVIVFVTDVPRPKKGAALAPHPGDLTLLQSFKEAAEGAASARPIVLALNKVDLAADKAALLPLIDALSKVLSFEAIVPLSARRAGDAERLMDVVAGLCPEGPWQFGPDDLTDRPARYFAAEYVREQILRATRLEVPHAAAVTIDRFSEAGAAVEIDVTIHVERPGQKKILIGAGGETLKRIGTAARLRLKEMLGRKVILKTWVRVTPAWRASAEKLADMGYEKKRDGEQVLIFAELEDDEAEEQ
jgi:GTPase